MRESEWDFIEWWHHGEGMPMLELYKKVIRWYVVRYGSVRKAADALKISYRTIYRYIQNFNINVDDYND